MFFILYPAEGLGNRLRAIDSALRYCEDNRCSIVVRWHRDRKLMNCNWEDIFANKTNFRNADKDYLGLQFLYKLRRHSKLFCRFLLLLKKMRILVVCGPDDWEELRIVTSSGKRYLWIIAESFSTFYWPEGREFKRNEFRLNEELNKRLAKEVSSFNKDTIGIHIRRTDNLEAISQSPTELFIDAIESIISGNEETNFYVCSDEQEVKDSLKTKFGERIITPSGLLERDSIEGIKQATLELFALASTTKIIGSHFSSFSEMASYLGQIPLVQIRKQI